MEKILHFGIIMGNRTQPTILCIGRKCNVGMHVVRLDVSCSKQHSCSKVTAKANTLLYYFFVDLDITAVQFGSISQKIKSKTTMV